MLQIIWVACAAVIITAGLRAVARLSFGWGFHVWSIPMIGALGLLLRAERQHDSAPVAVLLTHARAA